MQIEPSEDKTGVLVLLFATSRLGFIAIVTDRAGASEVDRFSLVLLFAASRVGFVVIVTDRAGEVGRRSSLVLFAGLLNCLVPSESESSLTDSEAKVLKKSKSCHTLYVTIKTIPSNFVPL